MADISKITLPNGNTYDIKDTTAREAVAAISGGDAVVFIGVSTTAITDNGSQSPITITEGGTTKEVTPKSGNIVFYGAQEFIYGKDDKWHALGDLSTLGDLAYQDSATGNYTPSGTISTPSFTGSSSSVSVTVTSNTNGNYQPAGTISKPTFTGATMTSTGTFLPSGTINFTTGAAGLKTIEIYEDATLQSSTFTPSGTVTVTTSATTNKTAAVSSTTGTATYTPAGTITVTTSATTNKTATVSGTTGTATYTPAGNVAAPTISVKTAGTTASINNPTKVTVAKTVVAAAPGATAPSNNLTYYSVSDETLSFYQLGYTTGDSITTSAVTVKTGDAAYQSSAPAFTGTGTRLITGNIAVPDTYTATFTGTGTRLVTGNIPVPSTYSASFTGRDVSLSGRHTPDEIKTISFEGTSATISVTGTTTGSVASPSFTGTKVQISGSTTASGSVSRPTFSGTQGSVTVS